MITGRPVSNVLFSTLVFAALAMPSFGATAFENLPSPEIAAKIAPNVLSKMENADDKSASAQAIPVLVYLRAQGNLSSAKEMATKEQKGRFVYDTLRQTAQSSQKNLVSWLNSSGLKYQRFFIVNMIAVFNPTPAQIEQLAARTDVERVVGNQTMRIIKKPFNTAKESFENITASTVGANISSTGAEKVWTEFKVRGEGIVVAGQDTGVDWTHPALKKKYRGSQGATAQHDFSWHDSIKTSIAGGTNKCGLNTKAPCDDDQHGSHTMGTIIGDDEAGNQIGMAPGAKWIACRNMDAGTGRPSTYIDCFEWLLAPYKFNGNAMSDGDPKMAPHVINNSWGCPKSEGCEGGEFDKVLQAFKAAGIMVVASAGNDGPSCSTIHDGPAFHSDLTLSVGAHDHKNGNIASFSSRGPSSLDNQVGPDVTAPGVNVRSSVPGGGFSGTLWSGTSMAGPHVVGAVALLWSADPKLIGKIDETIEILRKTATPKTSKETCGGVQGSKIPNNTYGYGLLDIYAAVKSRK